METKVVELSIVDHASDNTIGRVLKKMSSSHLAHQWIIPPQASSAFVAATEDILAVYKRPRDRDCPLVCLDEASKQLLADTRIAIPMKPGQAARRDYEYERNGTANLFMMFVPLEGWRRIKGSDRRTAIDYAQALEDLSDRYDTSNPNGVLATTYLLNHSTVSLTFNALFKGAPSAIGMHLDPVTGRVSVDAALPPLHKNNFIIEVTVTDSADAPRSLQRCLRAHSRGACPLYTIANAIYVRNPRSPRSRRCGGVRVHVHGG